MVPAPDPTGAGPGAAGAPPATVVPDTCLSLRGGLRRAQNSCISVTTLDHVSPARSNVSTAPLSCCRDRRNDHVMDFDVRARWLYRAHSRNRHREHGFRRFDLHREAQTGMVESHSPVAGRVTDQDNLAIRVSQKPRTPRRGCQLVCARASAAWVWALCTIRRAAR